jgi:CheY-like chemotaxis protein
VSVLHIFLAEDNQADVTLIRHALAVHGIQHQLHVAKDGETALQFVSCMGTQGCPPCPDLLLLDLNLPKVDGTEVLAEFRRHPSCAKTPVIVVSSSGAARDRARVTALGIDCYFQKPSDLDEFLKLGEIVKGVTSPR